MSKDRNHVHHQDVVAAPDLPAWRGSHHRACRCSTRWCQLSAIQSGRTRAPVRGHLRAARLHHGPLHPGAGGADFEFTHILKPLEPFRQSLVVVTGVNGPASVDGGGHALAPASWLTGTTAKKTQGADIRAGVSIDQVIAKQIGQDTVFPSLELATEDFSGRVGSCEIGFSCAYMNTISWSSADDAGADGAEPSRRLRAAVRGHGHARAAACRRCGGTRASSTTSAGGPAPARRPWARRIARRLAEYLENIRAIERRIQRAEQQARQKTDVPAAPSGIPSSFAEHVVAAVRPAGRGIPGRPHPRRLVHERPRRELPQLPGAWLLGRPSPALTSRQRPGEDGEVRAGERLRDVHVRGSSSRS